MSRQAQASTNYNRSNSKHIAGISKEFLQLLDAQLSIAQNIAEDLRMENLRCVKRNCCALPSGVLINHVTATLPGKREPCLFKHADNLARRDAGQFRH